jgi:hypothetical protein
MNTTISNRFRHLSTTIICLSPVASISLFLALLVVSACNPANRSVDGTYYLQGDKSTRLILQTDSSFIYRTLEKDSFLLNKGRFSSYSNGLQLTSLPSNPDISSPFSDSVSFFTSITSFSFWDSEGTGVAIRSIQINNGSAKAHYGNSLYYFDQDFKPADTIRFFFHGYSPLSYPGDIQKLPGNNGHKITLYETYLPGIYHETGFTIGRHQLRCKTLQQTWKKKRKS